MIWTKEINQRSGDFKNSSFLCEKEFFIKLLKAGTPFLNGAVKHLGSDNFIVKKDVAFQNLGFLSKFKGSKILMIGAGPTTNEIDYDITKYDYVWTCNHFYKNEKVKNCKVDFITLGNENNLNDEDLISYLDKNNTIICFENKYTNTNNMRKIKDRYPNRVFWAFTRYHSRIGSIPRLACIAISLGVEQIDFVGMDGYVPNNLRKEFSNSVFEPFKKPNGTIENKSDENEIISLYKKQYFVMWDYLLHGVGSDVKFVNLGHEHECNLSTIVLSDKLGTDYQKYLITPENRR